MKMITDITIYKLITWMRPAFNFISFVFLLFEERMSEISYVLKITISCNNYKLM